MVVCDVCAVCGVLVLYVGVLFCWLVGWFAWVHVGIKDPELRFWLVLVSFWRHFCTVAASASLASRFLGLWCLCVGLSLAK